MDSGHVILKVSALARHETGSNLGLCQCSPVLCVVVPLTKVKYKGGVMPTDGPALEFRRRIQSSNHPLSRSWDIKGTVRCQPAGMTREEKDVEVYFNRCRCVQLKECRDAPGGFVHPYFAPRPVEGAMTCLPPMAAEGYPPVAAGTTPGSQIKAGC